MLFCNLSSTGLGVWNATAAEISAHSQGLPITIAYQQKHFQTILRKAFQRCKGAGDVEYCSPMGLTSALLQSYFVRYPRNPSSTLALPNTSRNPLLKRDLQNTVSVSDCSEIVPHHITSRKPVQKGRQALPLPVFLFNFL